MKNLYRLYTAALMIAVLSCQERVVFDSVNTRLMVVDGFITNAPETHTIRLATSGQFNSKFDGGLEDPVINAVVTLESGSGHTFFFIERHLGFYDTPPDFQAIEGEVYVLCIQTQEGKHYQSTPQELKSSESMGDVHFEITAEEVLSSENIIVEEQRVNFYSDVSFPDKDYYYKWDWEGVFKQETTYFEEEERLIGRCPLKTPDIPEFCYVEENPNGGFINILSSNESTGLKIDEYLIVTRKVNFNWKLGYSMLLKQYSIATQLYDYWAEVEKQKERSGSIFDPVPAKIKGNIFNVDNSEEDVLGYFGVYGVKETRLFVPSISMPDSINSCLVPLIGGGEHPAYCCDCRSYDEDRSKAEKPDFWID